MQNKSIGFFGKALKALTAAHNTFKSPQVKECGNFGHIATDRDYLNMFSDSFMRGNYDITFHQAILFYCRVEPVASGVDWIADEFEHINPVIYNSKNNEFENVDSRLLKLLSYPNADVSGYEFRKQMAAYFIITGNCYIVATGTPGKEALELTIIQPQRVTIAPAADGYVQSYHVSVGSGGARIFSRQDVDGRFRFYANDGAELWHIRTFNPRFNMTALYGLSKLNSIFYEISQHLQGNIHNLSLLERGVRSTGALVTDAELTPDQRDRLKAELNNKYAGAENSGHVFLFENKGGAKTEFLEMSQNAKDSDYLGNRTAVSVAIFNRLRIPLPLINPEHMTLDNYEKAILALYDNAVLPLTDMMFGELTTFLGPRFKFKPEEKLSYDPNKISALEPRRAEMIGKKKDSGVLTINEIRTLYGYEEIEGGDALYQPMSMIAIGSDRFTGDNLRKPSPRKLNAPEMYALLKRQLDPDGKPRFTEAQLISYSQKRAEGLR